MTASSREQCISPSNIPDQTGTNLQTPNMQDLLTPREWEIATLLRNGLTTEEIANQLFITRGTILNHRYHIQTKLAPHSLSIWESDNNRYDTSPLPIDDEDIQKLSENEKQVLQLFNAGYNAGNVSSTLNLDIRYVLGCLDRFIFMQTPLKSRKHKRVRQLILQGYTNAEIAEELHVQKGTVKQHINKIFEEFEIITRDTLLLDSTVERAPQYIALSIPKGQDSDEEAFLLPEERFLTIREYAVCSLIVNEGLSNKEIGARLNIALGTVKTFLCNIFVKLSIRSRYELNEEILQLFCPQSIYMEHCTDSAPLSLPERSVLLEHVRLTALVPLTPQTILNETELEVFKNLARYSQVADIDPMQLRGLRPSQITALEVEQARQLYAVRTNEELADLMDIDFEYVKMIIHNVLDKLNIYTRKDAVAVYRFYQQEGIL